MTTSEHAVALDHQADQDEQAAPDAGPCLRVAIASQDGVSMNAHFGSARHFLVYEVTRTSSRLLERISFETVTGESGEHREDAPLGAKIAAIGGCNLLFVLAIGGAAASKVVQARIHPVKLAEPEPVEQVISKVQALMIGTPPPWLRKALASTQARSMTFLDEEDEP
jgi:nitrogen fixation protein NifX